MEHVDAIARGEPPSRPDRMVAVRVAVTNDPADRLALLAGAGPAARPGAQDRAT